MLCGLCGKPNVGLSHILAGCPWVLSVENKMENRMDRNTWRHNNVLYEIAVKFNLKIKEVNSTPQVTGFQKVNFQSWSKGYGKAPVKDFGILEDARDWFCDFDLPQLIAPEI